MSFERSQVEILRQRLAEPRQFIQIVLGPRQIGKTTAVKQALERIQTPFQFYNADQVTEGNSWINTCWETARLEMTATKAPSFILIFDEIQKISGWSEAVKKEWDNDTRLGVNIKVILLSSSRVLLDKGLSESLMGRFEEIRMSHWTWAEMHSAFNLDMQQYLYFGGYPGPINLLGNENRWRFYVHNAIIDATINRDVLLDALVRKPTLLRRTFELGASYSGQILSLNKMLGELQDAGNTTTLSAYLQLLDDSGLLTGLQKYSVDKARRRASIPKFQVHNNALRNALDSVPYNETVTNSVNWGRCMESAVGAFLISQAYCQGFEVFYWREGAEEVDFVLRGNGKLVALEVKSNKEKYSSGMKLFKEKFHPDKSLIIGQTGMPLHTFFSLNPMADLLV